jgi:hypothetical protein
MTEALAWQIRCLVFVVIFEERKNRGSNMVNTFEIKGNAKVLFEPMALVSDYIIGELVLMTTDYLILECSNAV